jgi:hypothetical protein
LDNAYEEIDKSYPHCVIDSIADAEVQQYDAAVSREPHVARMQVAVDDAIDEDHLVKRSQTASCDKLSLLFAH